MVKTAVIEIATGKVINVVELEPDADWNPPDGCEVRDGGDCGPGWTWNGTEFLPPEAPIRDRIDVLMSEGPATRVYNEETDVWSDRPAEDIAADKAELLGLLQSKLAASEDLTWEQMNRMLALERES